MGKSNMPEIMAAQIAKVVAEMSASKPETIMASIVFAVRASVGRKFDIRVIGTGEGSNVDRFGPWFVEDTAEGIGSARKVFGGARVYWNKSANGDFDHSSESVTSWLNSDRNAGYLSDLHTDSDGLFATLHVDEDVPEAVVDALREKALGFSVECEADRCPVVRGGKSYSALRNFRHPSDGPARVAIVSHPALRGEVMRLAASRQKEITVPEITDQDKAKAKADASAASSAAEKIGAELKAAQDTRKLLDAELVKATVSRGRADLDMTVVKSKLPEKSAALVVGHFETVFASGKVPSDEDVQKQITAVRDAISASDAKVTGLGANVAVGAEPMDKFSIGLERLLIGNAPVRVQTRFAGEAGHGAELLASREQKIGIGHQSRTTSWRRLVRESMGVELEDLWRHGSSARALRASINLAQWGDVFENILNKVGLAYQEDPMFEDWRKIVTVRSFNGSTLKQERMVVGGYANLPSVAESATYTAATTPGDEGHGYAVLKYGYTENWSREAQINDDVGALQQIIRKMALAADRTKYQYVFDQITIAGQPTMDYDAAVLFSVGHGNLGTTALSATSLAASRLLMKKQTDFSSSERLMLIPRFLCVPEDLEETAVNLLVAKTEEPSGSTTDREFLRRMNLEIIPVRHWTNAKDHVLVADPASSTVPVFEMGFLGGRDVAEIYVQDMTNVGSVFDADKVTVAIKQDYFGGSPMRHEAFYAQDVA